MQIKKSIVFIMQKFELLITIFLLATESTFALAITRFLNKQFIESNFYPVSCGVSLVVNHKLI